MELRLRAPHAGIPPVAANSLRQREEASGAAVARSETGGPPFELNSGLQRSISGGSPAADARGAVSRARDVSASPTPERCRRADPPRGAAAARSRSRPREDPASTARRAAAARSESSPREEAPVDQGPARLLLRGGDVAVVTRYGRDFTPLPSYLEIDADHLLPDAALTWDGDWYTRQDFVAYYGNDHLFVEARRITAMARAFLNVWFDYCKQGNDHTTINHLLVLMRKTEWRQDPHLADALLRYLFRTLTLRGAVLGLASVIDGHIATDAEMKALDERVRRWAVPFYRNQGSHLHPRQLQRLYWPQFFGHKTFAMTLARHGVREWLRTIQELERNAGIHDSDQFKDALARSRGAPVSKSAPPHQRPHTSDIGIWRNRNG